MDSGSLVFSLGLFLAGIWLVLVIRSSFKTKKEKAQRISHSHYRRHQARHISSTPNMTTTAADAAKSMRQTSTTTSVESLETARAGVNASQTAEQLQYLNLSSLRETFEKFTS